MTFLVLGLIGALTLVFALFYFIDFYQNRKNLSKASWLSLLGIGFITNFFDTLGIGSFAPTTSFYKLFNLVEDRVIPGTLNVGHTLPVVVQAFIFITVVKVEPITLISMMVAASTGAVAGAGVVSKLPIKKVRIGMSIALFLVALAMVAGLLKWYPSGGDATGLPPAKLFFAAAVNFLLGSLQTIGIGFYAPCMALVYSLGMSAKVAFPIMMGSCALLMPAAGLGFVKEGAYDKKAAMGLTLLGVIGVLIAAFVVVSLPLKELKWVVVGVILYTSAIMARSAFRMKK
jgi:uncharacterized membrane protein YfcA